MHFTYDSYNHLIDLLLAHGYAPCSYHDHQKYSKCVILRHDIDNSLEAALKLGEVEASKGIASTYFVLLTSDFYNVFSRKSISCLKNLQELGHEIGLHFDEVFYGVPMDADDAVSAIQKEAKLLSDAIGSGVTTVSMHRPSKTILDADLQIPGIINSYGSTFFHDFKYLSDSRRRWREPVEDIIRSERYDRLHILTHAFWYHDEEQSIEESISDYIRSARHDRYSQMKDNITDLESIVKEEDL
ncbi:MAG: hypothetical protein IKS87_01340 [Lachnospiraceae bacterium]|nr:hypothetical protein [Lachnospiraceae bacterium]